MNQVEERDCKICNLGQCDAMFRLGTAEFRHDAKGKLIQVGERLVINNCFAKELDKWIPYLNYYWSFKRFGLPYSNGWAEMPKRLFDVLNTLEIESQYLRKKG